MAWTDIVNDIISRYSGAGGGTAAAPSNPHEDFKNVADAAPPHVMADALSHVFRSDQTPPFSDMVSNLFQESNPEQRAGLLNRLLSVIGPAALAGIPGLSGGQNVTPQQASQVSPDEVRRVAARAENANPSIVDQVSGFYAQHPMVVKVLGGAILTMALNHLSRQK